MDTIDTVLEKIEEIIATNQQNIDKAHELLQRNTPEAKKLAMTILDLATAINKQCREALEKLKR